MATETGDRDVAEWLFSGWRRVALWLLGAAGLAVVGYRGGLGGKAVELPGMAGAAISAEGRAVVPSPARVGVGAMVPVGTAAVAGAGAVVETGAVAGTVGVAGTVPVVETGGVVGTVPVGTGGVAGTEGARGTVPVQTGAVPGTVPVGTGAVAEVPAGAGAGADGVHEGVTADGKVVLNVATEVELRKLPGIGKSRAKAIVEQRERVGKFRRLEDLLRVKGIGPKRLAQLRAKVVLDPP